jgi:hypothetical protein
MKTRYIVAASLGLLILAGVIWLLTQNNPADLMKVGSGPASTATPSGIPSTAPLTPSVSATESPAFVQKPGGPYEPRDPRWAGWNELMKRDPSFEWKMPISFYGQVVDEKGDPVPRANVKMIGTDISPTGNFIDTRVSDERGLFSLTGRTGKFLSVEVRKDGYYTSRENHTGFEYAAFSDPNYYQPDPNNPVIFHLRKKGESAPLVSSQGDLLMTFGIPSSIPIPGGTITPSPIIVNVYHNDAKARDWKAQITVGGGGIEPTTEEFPFQAPVDGYQSSINIDDNGWPDEEGGKFYIKTTVGYGLLELHQTRGKRTLQYSVLINSAGGTALESASNQQ